jgi:hypothetical protein
MRRSGWLCPGAEAALPHEATALRAVSHRLETETALASTLALSHFRTENRIPPPPPRGRAFS